MQRRKGIAYTDVLVLIVVLLFVWILGLAGVRHLRKIACKSFCSTNMKGLGTAISVYSNDYENRFPQLPGAGPWSKRLGFAYDLAKPDFKEGGAQSHVERTISASWYMLVREADVSPRSFMCGQDQLANRIVPFEGNNPSNRKIEELWDFGHEPHKHVSYAMHYPYGQFPAAGWRSASFAIAADMSPWFRMGDFVKPDTNNKDWRKNITLLPPYFSDTTITRDQIQQSNAIEHGREGQNVTFADGHAEYVKTSDVGIKHDNIYTYWSAPENPTDADRRIGTNPTSRDKANDAKSADDSFLAI